MRSYSLDHHMAALIWYMWVKYLHILHIIAIIDIFQLNQFWDINMDLKGAEIRNFYQLTDGMGSSNQYPENVVIPHYQRPYRWTEDNVRKLVHDWSNTPEDSMEYFTGSIVTVNQADSKRHDLIDGQQRFTTIYLVNFVKFMFCRVLIREAIQQNKTTKIEGLFHELALSSKYLFLKEEVSEYDRLMELSKNIIEEIDESDESDYAAKRFFQ